LNRWLSLFVAIVFWSCGHADDFDIEDWIDEQVGSGAVLSVTAMHVDGGEVIPYGGGETAPDSGESPDANTQFEIGSITKAFTNLLLAEMVARDAVSYETTIGELLGDDFTFANDAVGGITLLQLATHTSGLPRLPANLAPTDQLDPYRGYDEEALLEGIAGARDKQPLGNHYAYSNFGVGLLGYLLGQVQGDGYSGALEELVIRPLGLERTGFERAAQSAVAWRGGQVVKDWSLDALAGAGSLRSTTGDLARFATILLGEADNPLAHDLQADRKIVAPAGGFDITRVWHVGDSPDGKIFWHNGGTGGFWSFFGFRPATNEAVAILVSGDTEATGVGLRWLGFEPGQPPAADNDRSLLGQYNLNANFGIGVYEMDGRLVAQASGQMPLGLQEVGDDWYAMDVADASLHFLRENGKVVALELAQNGMLQRAEKSSDTAAALTKESVGKSRDALAAYVGEYPLNPSVKFTIRLGEEHLEAMLTGQPFFPIFPQGEDKFFYKVVDAELHFERDEHGDVDAVVLHQGGIVQRAEKAN
jgi:serine-type D-Ala-D-Ala carboxypeptidase/endopeptidase